MMKMLVDGMRANQGRRWIWRFAVAVLLDLVAGMLSLLWRSVSVLRVRVMFWIVCGILAVAVFVAVAVGGGLDDDVVSGLPLLSSSQVSATTSVTRY